MLQAASLLTWASKMLRNLQVTQLNRLKSRVKSKLIQINQTIWKRSGLSWWTSRD